MRPSDPCFCPWGLLTEAKKTCPGERQARREGEESNTTIYV